MLSDLPGATTDTVVEKTGVDTMSDIIIVARINAALELQFFNFAFLNRRLRGICCIKIKWSGSVGIRDCSTLRYDVISDRHVL